MDVHQHPRNVRHGAEGRLHLSLDPGVRHRVHHLGCHRPAEAVLVRADLLRPRILLLDRRDPAVHRVRDLAQVAELTHQVRQLPRHLLRRGLHPARVRAQLRALGDRRVHLQLRHPPPSLLVVDEVQL